MFGFQSETPSRVLRRALAAEREGDALQGLPGRPPPDSDAEFTEDESDSSSTGINTSPPPPARSPYDTPDSKSTIQPPSAAHRPYSPLRGPSRPPVHGSPAARPQSRSKLAKEITVPYSDVSDASTDSESNPTRPQNTSMNLDQLDELEPDPSLELHRLSLSTADSALVRSSVSPVPGNRSASRHSWLESDDEPARSSPLPNQKSLPAPRRQKVPSLSSASSEASVSESELASPSREEYSAEEFASPTKSERTDTVVISQGEGDYESQDGSILPSVYLGSPQKSDRAGSRQTVQSRAQTEDEESMEASAQIPNSRENSPANYAHSTPGSYGASFATPRPAGPDSDVERRKTHLLSALRLTAVRSTTRTKLKQGTPFPKRREAEDSPASSAYEASDTTSNDLTTHPRANNSLPLGNEADTRFSGAKLNSYLHTLNTHLTNENQNLLAALNNNAKEVRQLRRRLGVGPDDSVDLQDDETRSDELTHAREQISQLQAQLSTKLADALEGSDSSAEIERLANLVEQRNVELETLRERLIHAQTPTTSRAQAELIEELQRQVFQSNDQLSALTNENVVLKNQLSQTGDWQERVDELLLELEARDEELHRAREAIQTQDSAFAEKMEHLEEELCGVMEDQERQLSEARQALQDSHRSGTHPTSAAHNTLEAENRQLREALNQTREEATSASTNSRGQVIRLEAMLAAKQAELDSAKAPAAQHASHGSGSRTHEDLYTLRKDLADTRERVKSQEASIKSLEAQKFQLSKNHGLIADLESQLYSIRKENVKLRGQLAQDDPQSRRNAQTVQIDALEAAKSELEHRVESLRRQGATNRSGIFNTPGGPNVYKSFVGLQTPRTPGQFEEAGLATDANATISPLLAQIHHLELQVDELQSQLNVANSDIDDKLAKLDIAGMGRVSLAQAMENSRSRLIELEAELEALIGEGGSVHQLQRRLAYLICPECRTSFDANVQVPFIINSAAHALLLAGEDGGPRTRSSLASADAKLARVQAESEDHKGRLSTAREELKSLHEQLQQARSTIGSLLKEQQQSDTQRVQLEGQLANTEHELYLTREDLSRQDELNMGDLQGEETERRKLLQNLAHLNQHAEKLAKELAEAKSAGGIAKVRLESELAACRRSLQTAERSKRILAQEKESLLDGVTAMQDEILQARLEADVFDRDLNHFKRLYQDHAVDHRDARSIEPNEAKSLLSLTKCFKAELSRESHFRADLSLQKTYLNLLLTTKQRNMESTLAVLSRFGLSLPVTGEDSPYSGRRTLKGVALTIISIQRMRTLGAQWREHRLTKARLRQSYEVLKGKRCER